MKTFFLACFLLFTGLIAGCATSNPNHELSSARHPVGGPTQPVLVVAPLKPVQDVLDCLSVHGAFANAHFGLSPWIDSTQKANFVANGATGAYLPGASTTLFLEAALDKLRAKYTDYTDLTGENNVRSLVTDVAKHNAQFYAGQNVPERMIDGRWLTLDLSSLADADVQYANVGPFYHSSGATVVAALQIKHAGNPDVLANSLLRRTLFYSEVGVSFARYVGDNIATGSASVSHQQRLELESVEYLANFMLVDAMTKLPEGKVCRPMVDTILAPPISEARPIVVASK